MHSIKDYTGRELFEGDQVLYCRTTKHKGQVAELKVFTLKLTRNKDNFVLEGADGKTHAYFISSGNIIGFKSLKDV